MKIGDKVRIKNQPHAPRLTVMSLTSDGKTAFLIWWCNERRDFCTTNAFIEALEDA